LVLHPIRRPRPVVSGCRLADEPVEPGHQRYTCLVERVFVIGVRESDAIGCQRTLLQQDTSQLESLARQLPERSLALADLAAEITTGLVHRLRGTSKDTEHIDTGDLARWLNNQSNRLADLGRREDALAAITEAVAIYREVAAARPEAFRPDLTASLTNQSSALAELGRREDALAASTEAAAIRRELAAIRPVFRESLAGSLTSFAILLTEMGDFDGALTADREAVAIYAALLSLDPDRYRDPLERVVRNLVIDLRDLARGEQEIADELDSLLSADGDLPAFATSACRTVYGPRGGVEDAGPWAPGTGVSAGRQLLSHGRAAAWWRCWAR
jgi:tetratricopeptide (TPR) repeat protein